MGWVYPKWAVKELQKIDRISFFRHLGGEYYLETRGDRKRVYSDRTESYCSVKKFFS